MSSENAIDIRCLSVRLSGREIVHGVNLCVPKGGIVGLLGPSGSGKTTLIKAVMGMNRIFSGSVHVFGIPVPSLKAVSEIGYMAQSDALYDDLTAMENLLFFAGMFGIAGGAARKRAEELLSFVELSSDKGKWVRDFSGGMKRRLSLAIALMHRPKLLILDEPTVGIDPVLRKKFRDHFARLKDEGCTILLTTHVMDEANGCDSIVLLRSGSVIAEGGARELLTAAKTDSLEEAFLYYIGRSGKEAI